MGVLEEAERHFRFVDGSPRVFNVQLVHQDLQVILSDLAATEHHVPKPPLLCRGAHVGLTAQ